MREMADNAETDERYKRLERTLKLVSLKRRNRNDTNNEQTSPSVTFPSISSINADVLDSSYSQLMQTSRVESDFVSSSSNLKNILLKKMNACSGHKAIATSSVKKYDPNVNDQNSCITMQPPSLNTTISCLKRKSKVKACSLRSSERFDNQPVKNSVLLNHCASSCQVEQNDQTCDSSRTVELRKISAYSNNANDDCTEKRVKVFIKWRVMLNEQVQLIIKGTLVCGKVVRSKPIGKRLSATNVESVYKHTYRLQGNIVDERAELPSYIRGKFHNGFPDDWENVYKIWQAFVRQGRPLNFRWPTPVTDSDDDLKSGITEFTCAYMRDELSNGKTMSASMGSQNVLCSRKIPAGHLSTHSFLDMTGKTDKKGENDYSPRVNNISTQTYISGTVADRSYNIEREIVIRPAICNKNNQNKQENSNSNKNISTMTKKQKDVIDKLNVILRNVTDGNCSSEYINKIIEMFDCLNYFMSYRPSEESARMKVQKFTRSSEPVERSGHDVESASQTYCPSEEIPWQKDVIFPAKNTEIACTNGNLSIISYDRRLEAESVPYDSPPSKENIPEKVKEIQDNSESETYTGIPKISAERVLRQKVVIPKPFKRKSRKEIGQSQIEKHKLLANNTETRLVRPASSSPNNSSVSITEDEADFSALKTTNAQLDPVQLHQRNLFESKLISEYNELEFLRHATHFQNKDCSTPPPPIKPSAKTINGNIMSPSIGESLNSSQDCSKHLNKFDVNKSHAESGTSQAEMQRNVQTVCSTRKGSQRKNVSNKSPTKLSSQVTRQTHQTSETNRTNSVSTNAYTKLVNKEVTEEPKKSVKESEKVMRMEVPKEPGVSGNMNSIEYASSQTPKKLLSNNSDKLNEKKSSAKNPNVLTTWIPKIISDPLSDIGCGLVFQGNLLNEAGHVVNRKFTTDIVHRRLTPTLIETRNHEFYQLVGDLHDTKHVVPKELLSQCRNGCPSRIELFCKLWKSHDEAVKSPESMYETSMNDLKVLVSSKGRRILPPLNYWTGERVVLKNNNLVYDPGSTQSTAASFESPRKVSNADKNKARLKTESNVYSSDNEDAINHDKENTFKLKVSPAKLENNSKKLQCSKHRKSATKHKREVTKRLSSSDSSGNASPLARKRLKVKMGEKGSAHESKKRDEANAHTLECHPAAEVKKTMTTSSGKSRSASDIGTTASSIHFLKPRMMTRQSVAGRIDPNIICAYYNISSKEDTLSDDQTSCI